VLLFQNDDNRTYDQYVEPFDFVRLIRERNTLAVCGWARYLWL